jgi:endo-1,4-beta-xylanase
MRNILHTKTIPSILLLAALWTSLSTSAQNKTASQNKEATQKNKTVSQNKTASAPISEKVLMDSTKGLKDFFAGRYPMGVAVSPQSIRGRDVPLILKEFNSITAENAMKPGPIHPEENRWNWRDADSIVAFAERNGLKVRGHVLLWHEQTPDWFFKDEAGNDVSKEVLENRLKNHIHTIVKRYKGKIYAWDVVNEVVDDDSSRILRAQSPWVRIGGEDILVKAFQFAHEADPDALLFYNDYNAVYPEKRIRICSLLSNLLAKGAPIHGMGMQGHWNIFHPTAKDLEDALRDYSNLGLQIQITELDVSIYQWEKERRNRRPDESDRFTPELEQQQRALYKMAFSLFKKYEKHITGITFWNITDRGTWLDQYPVPGRKNYPLLFDTQGKRKKAYYDVVETLRE